jgi:hypothetical protein
LADHGIVTSLLEHLELAEKAFDDATRQPSAKPFFYVAHPKTEFIVESLCQPQRGGWMNDIGPANFLEEICVFNYIIKVLYQLILRFLFYSKLNKLEDKKYGPNLFLSHIYTYFSHIYISQSHIII